VDAHLVGLATETGADLLVVGTHRRAGLDRWTRGSVSRGILRHAPMNVACVPMRTETSPAIHRCRRVLAAVDLDKYDTLALSAAYSIVSEEGTVFLLNVEPSPRTPGRNLSQALARLKKIVPAETWGVRTEVLVEAGDVVQVICEATETNNADVVCVGAHTRPGVAARVMGSVALGVLQKCHRPVLVVWPED
jgi:nucleotide-binding universal stress UspA family protein